MGSAIEAWIEYDDASWYEPGRAAELPFSSYCDNCIPVDWFIHFSTAKDYRFFSAIAGMRSQQGDPVPLFPLRGSLPPNVSAQTRKAVLEIIGEDNPYLSWLSYPEIEEALTHMGITREKIQLSTNLVLDFMQSIERRLGVGRSRLIFYID